MAAAAEPPRGRTAPRRADARRNVAAILAAATECLARNPDTNMAEIAATAGVGRMTLYGHFPTRAELVDAVLTHTVAQAHEALDAVDISGEPRQAVARLVAGSWQLVDQFRNVLAAAERELPPDRIRAAHDRVLGRVFALFERGQRCGAFRTDLPLPWLTTLALTVMHAAATEVSAGRMTAGQAPAIVTSTLLAALTAPAGYACPP